MSSVKHQSALRSTCVPRLLAALTTGAHVEIITVENNVFTVKMPLRPDGTFPQEGIPFAIGGHQVLLVMNPADGGINLEWSVDVPESCAQRLDEQRRRKALNRYFGQTKKKAASRQLVAIKFAFIKRNLDIIAEEFNDYEK